MLQLTLLDNSIFMFQIIISLLLVVAVVFLFVAIIVGIVSLFTKNFLLFRKIFKYWFTYILVVFLVFVLWGVLKTSGLVS